MNIDIDAVKPIQDADTELVQTSEERQSLINAMLLRESDPKHQEMVEQVDAALRLIEESKSKLSRREEALTNAPKNGDSRKVEEAEIAVEDATQKQKDADKALKILRGDYIDDNLNALTTQRLSCAEQSPATPSPVETVETASDGPAPLTRNEIANCFAGLRGWDVNRWKTELSSPDDWLKACRQRKGTRGRGGFESTWWPVCIACAMVDRQDTTAKWVSARFKKQEPLKPWLDTWQTYHPDNA